jgi:hypothetical protein
MLAYAAQEKIKACYTKGIASLVSQGKLTQERAALWEKVDHDLIDLQLKPKSLFYHTPHNLSRQHILEAYPRTPESST